MTGAPTLFTALKAFWFELTRKPPGYQHQVNVNAAAWTQLAQAVGLDVFRIEEYLSVAEAMPWMTQAAKRGGGITRIDILSGTVTGVTFMAAVARGLQ